MNKVILMGRLTRDPEVRYSQGDNATAIARFTLAVDRRIKGCQKPVNMGYPDTVHSRAISARRQNLCSSGRRTGKC